MTMIERVAERVSAGAQLLDTANPTWFTKVDPKRVDVSNCNLCPLGQLYGIYGTGVRAIGLVETEAPLFGCP